MDLAKLQKAKAETQTGPVLYIALLRPDTPSKQHHNYQHADHQGGHAQGHHKNEAETIISKLATKITARNRAGPEMLAKEKAAKEGPKTVTRIKKLTKATTKKKATHTDTTKENAPHQEYLGPDHCFRAGLEITKKAYDLVQNFFKASITAACRPREGNDTGVERTCGATIVDEEHKSDDPHNKILFLSWDLPRRTRNYRRNKDQGDGRADQGRAAKRGKVLTVERHKIPLPTGKRPT